jgi:2,5-diketo-D-gluconate reductase B
MATEQLGSLTVPSPGFGTLDVNDGDGPGCVHTALEVGYRHVDTGQMYGNQASVGADIAAAPVAREDLFVATKILHPRLRDEVDLETTVADGAESVAELGVDSVDLLYLHWPDDYDLPLAFEAFERLYEDGYFDHFGVCNFTPGLLEEVRDSTRVPIEVVQVEMHPLLRQEGLRDYCERNDVALVAHCPLIRGRAPQVPELREIAGRYDATAAQVSLAWIRAKGAVPIPRASSEAHIRENWQARTLELDAGDVAKIDRIDREDRQADPDYGAW